MDAAQCERILREYAKTNPDREDWVEGEGPHAAVLISIVKDDPDCPVIFTRRSRKMRSHSGEICLPGGHLEERDKHSVCRAALREAKEEIGLTADQAKILGVLPSCRNSQGLTVFPVLAVIARPEAWQLQPREVTELLEVPLSFFLNPQNYRPERRYYKGLLRDTLAMQYSHWQIWGLTARIMRELQFALTATITTEQ